MDFKAFLQWCEEAARFLGNHYWRNSLNMAKR